MPSSIPICVAESLLLLAASCKHHSKREAAIDLGPPVLVNEDHSPNFSQESVDRVVVLPFGNESRNARDSEEVSENLRAELQLLGRRFSAS